MRGGAPIQRLTLALAAGVATGLIGAPLWMAPLLAVVALAAPIRPFHRPDGRVLALAVVAGWVSTATFTGARGCDMPGEASGEAGGPARVAGYFLAAPRSGSAPFLRADGCGPVTVVVSEVLGKRAAAGVPTTVVGRWRQGSFRPWLRATDLRPAPVPRDRRVHRAVDAWRDRVVARVHGLYGARGPLVAALTLARREGMDRDVRDAFAVAGIAHLLAISGFHVGVFAGLALGVLRGLGVSRRRSGVGAAVLAWCYVAFIGFPDAACRAAAILAMVGLTRLRGRPPTRWGALSAAALLLLLSDPSRMGSAGFQLSFAGAAGLVAWSRTLEERMGGGWGRHAPAAFRSSVAAGVAATVATLPVVAWHFDRVSLVGIPMTLVASSLVSLALPGALASVALDPVAPELAAFVAGGVDLLLAILVRATEFVAGWSGASLWVSRPAVLAGAAGVVVSLHVARRPGVGGRARRRLTLAYMAAGLVGWPAAVQLQGTGTLELLAIDVGQGDAVALRSPRGRWMLVDAGPPPDGAAAGHPAVRALRSRGARRLEALVLTHPDADHYGGAAAVLESFPVGVVVDPLVAAPKATYADLLSAVGQTETPWSSARAGDTWEMDGVRVRVLHPAEEDVAPGVDANDASVVLLVEWRGFRALLTGDAYVDVERRIAPEVGDIDVLKVGHHGSRTSTAADFLEAVEPEWALVSVGRGNRYGHPAPKVVRRLEGAGAEILRTDRHGTVRMVVGRDARVSVRTERSR